MSFRSAASNFNAILYEMAPVIRINKYNFISIIIVIIIILIY